MLFFMILYDMTRDLPGVALVITVFQNKGHIYSRIYAMTPFLCFGLLFQGEGTYPKNLDVKTFPMSCSNRGASKLHWSEMPSKQKALVFPKKATKI